ncbi:PEP-CTERM sorting domain-containing protein [Massilia sp. KIM]|uniref:PEP-CTERM sorting domain-containing protein n=1 Tax=Massilia sp. KIM TaxID=1955422 RepID=UPI001E5E0656|nr:PEP-CTERM sorting domain-containing protein [Massilia sp. KIM]
MQAIDGVGGTGINASLGQQRPALHTQINNFGISFANSSNHAFIGDYGKVRSVTLSIDVLAISIKAFGQEVPSKMVLELRDYDNTPSGVPYTSVWYDLGTIDFMQGWKTLSVSIADTKAHNLPAGWGGFGSPDDIAGPSLPEGRSFADVLSSVDELAFSTIMPGFQYQFHDFDVAIDNISIVTEVPEPQVQTLMFFGTLIIAWVLKRKSKTLTRSKVFIPYRAQ